MRDRRQPLRTALLCLSLAGVATPGCVPPATVAAAGTAVELVKTPNGGIQPQAVADNRGTLHLIYFHGSAGAGDLFYVRRGKGESSFSAPVRVNSQPKSAIAAGTIRGGQLALGKGGRLHVVWNGSSSALPKGPLNPAMAADSPYNGTPLLYTRLNDSGTAFEPQRNLMQHTFALDGGASVAADRAGNVYVAWHAGSGTATGEEERRLWIARSRDDGRTFGRETAPWSEPAGACACCQVKVFADSRSSVYALYRAATRKVDRDMVLLTSLDRGASFRGERIHPWKVDT